MGKSIDAKNLNIYYGSFLAVEGVNMSIRPQTVTALIGPSGCGKSTYLRSINRMHEVIPGAHVKGDAGARRQGPLRPRRRPGGGAPPDRHGLPAAQPVPDDVDPRQRDRRAAGSTTSGCRKDATDELVESSLRGANLWNEVKDRLDKPGSGLSGGQQQRLCIARAIAVQPDVLLMDEPCSALDPISTLAIEDLINELKNEYTIVIVTHNMQQAARVSDFTGLLQHRGHRQARPPRGDGRDQDDLLAAQGEGDRGLRVRPVRLTPVRGNECVLATRYRSRVDRVGLLAGHRVDGLAGDQHRVVGEALVVARQQREVHGRRHPVRPRRVAAARANMCACSRPSRRRRRRARWPG